jgi:hypothetical protein
VTGRSEFDDANPKSARDAAAEPSQGERTVLQEGLRKINDVLKIIREAEETPDLLDRVIEINYSDRLLGGSDVKSRTTRPKKIPQAEYLYLIALACRDAVQHVKNYLHKRGWTEKNEKGLQRSFEALQDAWTTYKDALRYRYAATWDEGPTPVQTMAALARPRREYIGALDIYRTALSLVVSYL